MNITTLNGHASYDEAKDFLAKLAHPDLYGIFGIYKSDEEQMYCVMPKETLAMLASFSEDHAIRARSKE